MRTLGLSLGTKLTAKNSSPLTHSIGNNKDKMVPNKLTTNATIKVIRVVSDIHAIAMFPTSVLKGLASNNPIPNIAVTNGTY